MGHHVYTGLPVAIKIVDKIHAPAVAREVCSLNTIKQLQ